MTRTLTTEGGAVVSHRAQYHVAGEGSPVRQLIIDLRRRGVISPAQISATLPQEVRVGEREVRNIVREAGLSRPKAADLTEEVERQVQDQLREHQTLAVIMRDTGATRDQVQRVKRDLRTRGELAPDRTGQVAAVLAQFRAGSQSALSASGGR